MLDDMLLVRGVVFSLVYLAAVLLAGVVTPEEKDLVRRKVAGFCRLAKPAPLA